MYENITAESIKSGILKSLEQWSSEVGSFAYTLTSPMAFELWKYYTQLEATVSMVFPDENSGIWIDKHADQYGIGRKPGEKATARITFTGDVGTKIPAGKKFLTSDGLAFLLWEEVILPGEGVLVAEKAGAEYNVRENEIKIQQQALVGLKSWTTTAATGGVDPESDKSLVQRYYDRLRMPATSGNVYHYQQWAREVPGVGSAKVYPLWAGPGTVKVVLAGDGVTVPSSEIVQAAKVHIDSVRPIGADVTVEAATALTVTVSATIEMDVGGNLEKIKEEFRGKLGEYLLSLAFDAKSEVVLTYVGHLLSECKGVYDYSALTLNGAAENLAVAETDIPILGEVTLNEAP